MLVKQREDLLEKGFQLAHFLIPNRTIAIQILSAAMSKFKAQRSRETKRAYWRDKYLKRKITRIARDEGDLLQWLIYFAAEDFERQQERAGEQTTSDMVVRYIKYLVQMTTAMSSFYVNVGLHRLLHNYTTSEVQRVYESITQHYPGDQEYRKVKATLMNKLERRFNNFIRTCTAHYGELRFQVFECQESWAELVDKCLRAFTPWSTARTCDVLASLDTHSGALPFPLSGKPNDGSVDQDMVEMHRCHIFIEPSCYGWLANRFGLDPPHTKLAVPKFFLREQRNNQRNWGPGLETTPGLTEAERRQIMEQLAAEAARRQRASLESLRISADGRECVRLGLGERHGVRFEIEEGTRLLEIWTEDRGENLLLATHWIEYSPSWGIVPSGATVDLGRERQLLLEVTPKAKLMDEAGGASIFVKWQPVTKLAGWRDFLRTPPLWFHALPKYALAPLLLLAIGGILGTVKYSRELVKQQTATDRLRQELARAKAARTSLEQALEIERGVSTESYLLVPNDLRVRGTDGPKEPVISLSAYAPLVVLELPLGGYHGESYQAVLKSFLEDREILSEKLSKSTHTLDDKLKFPVPVALVEDGKHYVVILNAITSSGKLNEVRKFTFYVKKN